MMVSSSTPAFAIRITSSTMVVFDVWTARSGVAASRRRRRKVSRRIGSPFGTLHYLSILPNVRLLLTLQYLGTRYAGWQWQANALGIQQVVTEALERMFGG